MATVRRQCRRRDAARGRRLSDSTTPLDRLVFDRIGASGPVPYAEVVELALYHADHGFYASGGAAGRRADFITSPEVGPLFGVLIGGALDREWDRLGRPESFTVIDAGAGPGTLARSIHAAAPRCLDSTRYIGVERSAVQRSLHPTNIEPASELPTEPVVGMIIANELLDNLPFTPVRRVDGELRRIDVGTDDGRLVEVPGAALGRDEYRFDHSTESAVLQDAAAEWLGRALASLHSGRVVIADYARTVSSEVEVRTYALHGRAGDPLAALGSKDITADVDLTQLQQRVRAADRVTTQADYLLDLGVDTLVEEGRAAWEEGAAVGDLEALTARSRIREAEALLDPDGLGGFMVAEWTVG